MGALNSRRLIMLDEEEVSWLDQSEDTSEYSESDESEIDRENELVHELRTRSRNRDYDGTTHFVAMLHNLISRGGLMIDNSDDHDEAPMNRKPPKIKYKIDTSALDHSEFSLLTRRDCGLLGHTPKSTTVNHVISLLRSREYGFQEQSKFSAGTKNKITSWYLPNEMVSSIEHSTGKVFCGIFSADGNTFLTASQDRYIRIYDSRDCTYKMLKSIKARDVGWSLIDVAFSPDGEQCVYSTWSTNIHMCQVSGDSDRQEPFTLTSANRRFCVFSVVYSSDGKELVCGANNGCLYTYDIQRTTCTSRIEAHEYDTNRVLFADDTSQIIYSGGDDGLVKVWDRRTLRERNVKPVGVLAGHMDGITYIDSRGDARHLISNSKDQSIKLWDLRLFSNRDAVSESLKAVRSQRWDYRWQGVPKELYEDNKLDGDTSLMTYRGHVVSKTLIRARFSPVSSTGQRFIYTGCSLGRFVVYDALTGKIVSQRKGHMSCVRDVAWHPTRNEIVTSAWDGIVAQWRYSNVVSLNTKKEAKTPLRRSARLAAMKRRQMRESTSSEN
ncbi:DDB1- and CUL4-associated factor 11 [Dendroctonus ponderosae]|uniref:DDB1- and CUL4-associated factor 11 n=1 Tax=Dendroctonus ponderosae TaxID=77166 RepID=U4UL24_DENPD|nr:DDB1- and CUL4-associated factor 11 [Dendroctonus ponderosae]XP_019761793.1 DDB1- and CUL4-associated factor 11 [Dendroctonus ponderosae]ERL90715.1 hypothetical protein D910_08062 [Dendroctonus ponderosae]KAH1002884.1 hypothetical protein HUJ04_008918 [Dendroctonus ponderosae]KAH1008895.1 hypothetical protein HUJ05_009396 [Dendroctonus ponderosae]